MERAHQVRRPGILTCVFDESGAGKMPANRLQGCRRSTGF